MQRGGQFFQEDLQLLIAEPRGRPAIVELEIGLDRVGRTEGGTITIDGGFVDSESRGGLGGGETGIEHQECGDLDVALFLALGTLFQAKEHPVVVVELEHRARIRLIHSFAFSMAACILVSRGSSSQTPFRRLNPAFTSQSL